MHAPFEFNFILWMEFSSERPHFAQIKNNIHIRTFDLRAMKQPLQFVRPLLCVCSMLPIHCLCALRFETHSVLCERKSLLNIKHWTVYKCSFWTQSIGITCRQQLTLQKFMIFIFSNGITNSSDKQIKAMT